MKNLQAKNILKIHFICRELLISVPTLETTQNYSISGKFCLTSNKLVYGVDIVQSIVSRSLLQRVFTI